MRLARGVVAAGVVVVVGCHGGAAVVADGAGGSVDRVARTCARVASCAHAHEASRERDPGACVDAWIAKAGPEQSAFETCVAGALGCEEVGACVRGKVDLAAASYCKGHPGARTGCDGTHLVACGEDDVNESTSTDCAALGASCGDSKQPGGLATRACISGALCPSGAPEGRCEGTAAVLSCHDGVVGRTACAHGARCEEHRGADGVPSALCELPGHRHCDVVGKRWCEGDVLVTCGPHGSLGEAVTTDCAASGLACEGALQGGAACAVRGVRSCDHGAAKCVGDALSFCAAGVPVRVSCHDLGFAGCDPDAHGVDAACATVASHP
ncbi:MAG TPA: hypothetical protein VIF09_02990 [Polyangiaceae bacterium]